MMKTSDKVRIARLLSSVVRSGRAVFGKTGNASVKRSGIQWNLDLNEGIDLSIYLLGCFEPRTIGLYKKVVKPGYTVLDIGANIGAHTLPFAKLVGNCGNVVAFEPTAYAYEKLVANIALNPILSSRIVPWQAMLAASRQAKLELSLFSSWPLKKCDFLHEAHQGQLMETSGAAVVTLDDATSSLNLSKIDFVKIDVDGHEYEVLKGGLKTLSRYRPSLMIEFAPYLIDFGAFCEMVDILRHLGYRFRNANTLRQLPGDAHQLQKMIPEGMSLNVYCS